MKVESRNRALSIPFLWNGKGLAEGEKNAKPTSAPSGHLLPKEGGKKEIGHRHDLYFAALRSFDSVLIFSDKPFF